MGFPGGSVGKESACNARDAGSIPGLGRFPGGGMVTHSSILVWRIPGTREPGRLQSIESQRVGHDWSYWAHTAWPILIQILSDFQDFVCVCVCRIPWSLIRCVGLCNHYCTLRYKTGHHKALLCYFLQSHHPITPPTSLEFRIYSSLFL